MDAIAMLNREIEAYKFRIRHWTPEEFSEAREWCDQAVSKSRDGFLTQNEMRLTNTLVHALDSLASEREAREQFSLQINEANEHIERLKNAIDEAMWQMSNPAKNGWDKKTWLVLHAAWTNKPLPFNERPQPVQVKVCPTCGSSPHEKDCPDAIQTEHWDPTNGGP